MQVATESKDDESLRKIELVAQDDLDEEFLGELSKAFEAGRPILIETAKNDWTTFRLGVNKID